MVWACADCEADQGQCFSQFPGIRSLITWWVTYLYHCNLISELFIELTKWLYILYGHPKMKDFEDYKINVTQKLNFNMGRVE